MIDVADTQYWYCHWLGAYEHVTAAMIPELMDMRLTNVMF